VKTKIRPGTRVLLGFVAIGALATLVALPGEPAFAKRMVGTSGADRIVGTKKPDRISARRGNDHIVGRQGDDRLTASRGNDWIKGSRGNDRLSAGRGADRLNAVDGKKDSAVNGGPGKDVCTIDPADQSAVKSCEKTKVTTSGGGGGGGGGGKCLTGPPEARPQVAGETRGLGAYHVLDEDAPPKFSRAFYGVTITLNASADGAQGSQLPISIEEVCDVPKSLAKEANQLPGADAVATVGPGTKVFKGGKLLQGQAATRALADLDSVSLRARLKGRSKWALDEDGSPVPTFGASQIKITD
jgi:Ca2+-binding RTX toxin-like protein